MMKSRREVCRLRQHAESKSNSLIARLWLWHSMCCHQVELNTQRTESKTEPSKIA